MYEIIFVWTGRGKDEDIDSYTSYSSNNNNNNMHLRHDYTRQCMKLLGLDVSFHVQFHAKGGCMR